jgi:hypothetical protein
VTAMAGSDGRRSKRPGAAASQRRRVDAARGARPFDDCASSAKARILMMLALSDCESCSQKASARVVTID